MDLLQRHHYNDTVERLCSDSKAAAVLLELLKEATQEATRVDVGMVCARRNFVVNAPGFFSLVWRIAEPMLSPSTRKKIILLHNKQVRTMHPPPPP